MKDEHKFQHALAEYRRLVAILDDENWTNADQSVIEQQLGRPIVPDPARNSFATAYTAYGQAIVDAIAEALEVGVSQKALVDNRGWLSHNDMRGYIARASRPYASNYTPNWTQATMLRAVRTDVTALEAVDSEAAANFLRSAITFFRRWVNEIPEQPSAQQLEGVATRWQPEHVILWTNARKKLVAEVEALALPKGQA